jgi:dolichol-phosphate mannosyltransferase
MAENTVVCLPTYNEAETLPPTFAAVRTALPGCRVLVIDGASPDGTGDIAEALGREDSGVHLLRRPQKDGLGRAYADGFAHALDKFGDCGFIVQMDADGSHPPEALPCLLAAAEEADLVIGSRYIPGGRIENFALHRRLLSRFGSIYARFFTRLPVSDLTGGFKVWRREILQEVLRQPFSTGGYAFQVETTLLAARLGGRIRELPIVFRERKDGTSKMSLAIALEAFLKVPLLRWRHRRIRAIKRSP